MSAKNTNTTVRFGAAATVARLGKFGSSKSQKQCPNCRDKGVPIFDSHSGDELCSRCGIVLEGRVMSEEQEWRTFSNADGGSGGDRSRVGQANDLWSQGGVQGTSMIGATGKHSKLIQTHEMATVSSGSDRQLRTAFANLRLISDSFSLRDNVVERCKEIIKDLQNAGNLKNRTGTTYMLGIVYLACREEGGTRTIREMVQFDRTVTDKELGRTINRIKKLLPSKQARAAAAEAAFGTGV